MVLIEALSAHLLGWRDELCEPLVEPFGWCGSTTATRGSRGTTPVPNYGLEDMADDVVEQLDHLGATSGGRRRAVDGRDGRAAPGAEAPGRVGEA